MTTTATAIAAQAPHLRRSPCAIAAYSRDASSIRHLSAVDALSIPMRDARGLLCRQLPQPVAIARHDRAVARPALIDPGVGAEEEAVGIAGEQLAPFGRYAAALGNPAAIGQFHHQRRVLVEERAHLFDRGR